MAAHIEVAIIRVYAKALVNTSIAKTPAFLKVFGKRACLTDKDNTSNPEERPISVYGQMARYRPYSTNDLLLVLFNININTIVSKIYLIIFALLFSNCISLSRLSFYTLTLF